MNVICLVIMHPARCFQMGTGQSLIKTVKRRLYFSRRCKTHTHRSLFHYLKIPLIFIIFLSRAQGGHSRQSDEWWRMPCRWILSCLSWCDAPSICTFITTRLYSRSTGYRIPLDAVRVLTLQRLRHALSIMIERIPSYLWNDVAKERQLPTRWVNVA